MEEVQAIVKIANEFKIPLFPISTGKNLGYGSSAPPAKRAGCCRFKKNE
ncbi:TPA: FAD-binding protein [Campylobacter coli]|nr:FAD-binding protein [Campylobacter coli]HED6274721.1 FAD-binding protein [Campylobacter coli]